MGGNGLLPEGAAWLGVLVTSNALITRLHVGGNDLGPGGGEALGEAARTPATPFPA